MSERQHVHLARPQPAPPPGEIEGVLADEVHTAWVGERGDEVFLVRFADVDGEAIVGFPLTERHGNLLRRLAAEHRDAYLRELGLESEEELVAARAEFEAAPVLHIGGHR